MKRVIIFIAIGVVLALAVATALAEESSTDKGINLTKEFTVLGKKVVVALTSPSRVEITVDGAFRYGGGAGIPTRAVGGFQSIGGLSSGSSAVVEGPCVAAEFADPIDLKDHSVLVFETWYKTKDGLVGRVWLESVWPSEEKGAVDGYLLNHDGTYTACIETLPAGTDPMKAKTAVKTVAKTGDAEFQYHCGGTADRPARTTVYKRVMHYDLVEPPVPDK
jgi:hypothetical protein